MRRDGPGAAGGSVPGRRTPLQLRRGRGRRELGKARGTGGRGVRAVALPAPRSCPSRAAGCSPLFRVSVQARRRGTDLGEGFRQVRAGARCSHHCLCSDGTHPAGVKRCRGWPGPGLRERATVTTPQCCAVAHQQPAGSAGAGWAGADPGAPLRSPGVPAGIAAGRDARTVRKKEEKGAGAGVIALSSP